MNSFKFVYEGWPNKSEKGTMTTGIKLLEGHPVDVGRCLGVYADAAFKKKQEKDAAMIVINAYIEFKKRNPDLTRGIENEIAGQNGGIIRLGD